MHNSAYKCCQYWAAHRATPVKPSSRSPTSTRSMAAFVWAATKMRDWSWPLLASCWAKKLMMHTSSCDFPDPNGPCIMHIGLAACKRPHSSSQAECMFMAAGTSLCMKELNAQLVHHNGAVPGQFRLQRDLHAALTPAGVQLDATELGGADRGACL